MKKLLIAVAPLLLWVAAISCGKKTIAADDAGKGGNATLRITPRHHGRQIDSLTVFIKYNTSDAPATFYDDSATCVMTDTIPVATFAQLKKGQYYIYGYGWDPLIQENVKGGIPYSISSEDTNKINLPVTEGD